MRENGKEIDFQLIVETNSGCGVFEGEAFLDAFSCWKVKSDNIVLVQSIGCCSWIYVYAQL